MTVGKVSTFLAQHPVSVYLREVEGRRPHHDPSPFTSLSMRKIEQQMIDAINNNQDWKSANTEVIHTCDNVNPPVSHVYLHGNKIAEVGDDFLKLFDGGWQTTTTKSRLNALLSEFGYTCGTKKEFIFQKQFEWFVNFVDIKTEQMLTIPFVNGMRLAG